MFFLSSSELQHHMLMLAGKIGIQSEKVAGSIYTITWLITLPMHLTVLDQFSCPGVGIGVGVGAGAGVGLGEVDACAAIGIGAGAGAAFRSGLLGWVNIGGMIIIGGTNIHLKPFRSPQKERKSCTIPFNFKKVSSQIAYD